MLSGNSKYDKHFEIWELINGNKWDNLTNLADNNKLKKRWGFTACFIKKFNIIYMHGGFDSQCN